MMRYRKLFWMLPVGIAAILVLGFIAGHIVRLFWNWLMPPIFGWSEITFWQALGLLVLFRILFGGRGGNWLSPSRSTFTREERERFRQRMRERFCEKPPTGEGDTAATGAKK